MGSLLIIGTLLGIVFAFLWIFKLNRFYHPKSPRSNFILVSSIDIKLSYPEFDTKRVGFIIYSFVFSFIQFLLFALWLFYMLDKIRPNISDDLETNLVGFLFFQTMVLNLSLVSGLYGFFFKLYGLSNSIVRYMNWNDTSLHKGLSYFYVIGDEAKRLSKIRVLITVSYWLVVHFSFLMIWA